MRTSHSPAADDLRRATAARYGRLLVQGWLSATTASARASWRAAWRA